MLRALLPALLLASAAAPVAAGAIALGLDASAPLKTGAFRWHPQDDESAGELSIVVSIARQMVYVYRGDRLIGQATGSTGSRGHETPLGDFNILQKKVWHRSNLYSNAPMPFMQRLTWDGIALHAGHLPGYPASHGCIRLPRAFAERLFAMTKLGTPVTVLGRFGAPPVYLRFDDIDWIVAADTAVLGGARARPPRDPSRPHWAPIDEIEAVRSGKHPLDYDPAAIRD